MIEFNTNLPIYIQITEFIRNQIISGELSPGEKLESVRSYAEMYEVNPNTVQKSYKEMEEIGIINTIKSYQSIITTDENVINKIRYDLINESMEVFIENMKAINVNKEELIEIIKDKY